MKRSENISKNHMSVASKNEIITPISASSQRKLLVHILASLDLPSRFTSAVRRKSTSGCRSSRTRIPIWRSQLSGNHTLVKFIWMRCTLAWARLAFRSLMRPKTSHTPASYTTCSFPGHLSCLPYLPPLPSSRARSLIMTSDGRLLKRQSIVALITRRIMSLKSTSASHDIQQLAGIFQTTNMSKISITTLTGRKFVPMSSKLWSRVVLMSV